MYLFIQACCRARSAPGRASRRRWAPSSSARCSRCRFTYHLLVTDRSCTAEIRLPGDRVNRRVKRLVFRDPRRPGAVVAVRRGAHLARRRAAAPPPPAPGGAAEPAAGDSPNEKTKTKRNINNNTHKQKQENAPGGIGLDGPGFWLVGDRVDEDFWRLIFHVMLGAGTLGAPALPLRSAATTDARSRRRCWPRSPGIVADYYYYYYYYSLLTITIKQNTYHILLLLLL